MRRASLWLWQVVASGGSGDPECFTSATNFSQKKLK
jgi:hypothetical protein